MPDGMAELNRDGRAAFAEMVADGEARLDRIFQATPALGELAVGTVYGHLHARRALDPRTREVATLAAIVAAGCTETPLSVHVRTALAAGLSPAEISEVVVQTAAFAGFPRAVTAAGRLPELFTDAGSPVPPDPTPREVLLDLLADPSTVTSVLPRTSVARVRSMVDAGHGAHVLTVGPHSAVALMRDQGGALIAVVEATVESGTITALTVLTPPA